MRSKEKAFTLIELLIVVAIIIALASIAFSIYLLGLERARRVECMNNLRQIHLAWQMCVEDLEHIPESQWELFGVPPDHPAKKQNPNAYTGPWWRYAKTRFDCPLAISLAPEWFQNNPTGTYAFPIVELGGYVKKGLIKREPKYPPPNAAVAICNGVICTGKGIPPKLGPFHDLGVDLSGHIGRIVVSQRWCDAIIEFENFGKAKTPMDWITIQ